MAKGAAVGIIVVVAIVIVATIFLISPGGEEGTELQVPVPGSDVDEMIVSDGTGDSDGDGTTGPQTKTIEMTTTGFSPSRITINRGDTVNFISAGASRWPASNVHPTHTVYPGSSISKCGGADELNTFDACRSTEDYSFIFDSVGTWGYHDHFSPGRGGTITVVG